MELKNTGAVLASYMALAFGGCAELPAQEEAQDRYTRTQTEGTVIEDRLEVYGQPYGGVFKFFGPRSARAPSASHIIYLRTDEGEKMLFHREGRVSEMRSVEEKVLPGDRLKIKHDPKPASYYRKTPAKIEEFIYESISIIKDP